MARHNIPSRISLLTIRSATSGFLAALVTAQFSVPVPLKPTTTLR